MKRISHHRSIVSRFQASPLADYRRIANRCFLTFLALLATGFVSCTSRPESESRNQSSTNSSSTSGTELNPSNGIASRSIEVPDANTLLRSVANRYAVARSYRDQGELLLTYKLQGRAIKEPHPYSLAWTKDNQISMRLFKSHLQADGKLLSCYVYDILTANLDEQQLFLSVEKQLPLTSLLEDSIVRHYLGGYADLPLDETDKTQLPRLLPPTLALLSGQFGFGWVSDPQIAQRLPDQTLSGRPCYVVRSQFNGMSADLWIDQETKLLAQISMPLKIMDRQVLTSGEIEDVELLLRFSDAAIDFPASHFDSTLFQVALKPKATPVRRFVSVPDPFPSERIGQLVPKFELLKSNGERVDHLYFDNKTAALIWADGAVLEEIREPLEHLKQFVNGEDVTWGIVYSDGDLARPEENSLKPQESLEKLAKQLEVPLFFDRQLQTSHKFQLQVKPAIAIVSPTSKLEFVGSLSKEKWHEEASVVIEKVRRGVDVAAEMRTAYQEFQANYQQQRIAASARSYLDTLAEKNEHSSVANSADALTTTLRWNPKLAWSNKSLTKPGNILVNHRRSPPSLLVMDGYRMVVEMDFAGSVLNRFQLELPEQGAVSCLRMVDSSDQRDATTPVFAGFNVQGSRVFLFNEEWKLLNSLPPDDFEHDGIRDVVLLPRAGQQPLVIVALANAGGCIEFDCETQVMTQVFRSRADSIAVLSQDVYYCSAASWGRIQGDSEPIPATDDLLFQRMISISPIQQDQSDFLGMTAVDRENNWNFGRLGSNQKLEWRQPVGGQLFENEIEPIATCHFTTGGRSLPIIAVADAANRVTLIDGDGAFLGQFAAPAPVAGIALFSDDGGLNLVLSTQQGLANYRLTGGGVSATPVSNPRRQ